MLQFVSLFALIVLEKNAFGRIIVGSNAAPGEVPYIVSLQTSDNVHFCGGAILDPTHILTAAHCLEAFKNFDIQIQYGTIDRTSSKNKIKVAEKHLHPQFKPDDSKIPLHDIGLIMLNAPIIFSEYASAVQLPDQGEVPPYHEEGVLAGWGFFGDHQNNSLRFMQRADKSILSDAKCADLYHEDYVSTSQICVGEDDKGQCTADCGSPIVVHGKVIGVVSWIEELCAKYPSVFTKVSEYSDWIKEKAGGLGATRQGNGNNECHPIKNIQRKTNVFMLIGEQHRKAHAKSMHDDCTRIRLSNLH